MSQLRLRIPQSLVLWAWQLLSLFVNASRYKKNTLWWSLREDLIYRSNSKSSRVSLIPCSLSRTIGVSSLGPMTCLTIDSNNPNRFEYHLDKKLNLNRKWLITDKLILLLHYKLCFASQAINTDYKVLRWVRLMIFSEKKGITDWVVKSRWNPMGMCIVDKALKTVVVAPNVRVFFDSQISSETAKARMQGAQPRVVTSIFFDRYATGTKKGPN